MELTYFSVCSGIEAATVAWHPLGWTPVGFSEIEPFPCKLLAHHYPNVPNHGDLTKHADWNLPEFDLLVGGTPCQAFSIAGLRKGLEDPRGNLTLVFLGLVARARPKWVVWENVPGVLSDRTNAFGSFLGGLGELGYSCAYRVLDAKNFGVPQRRRRVFVVGHLGDWRRAAAVLFEPEGMRRDLAAGGEEGEGVAGGAEGGAGKRCTQGSTGDGLARCLTAGELKRGSDWETANYVTHSLRADGFDASEDGTGRGTPLVPVAYAIQDDTTPKVKEEEGYALRRDAGGEGACVCYAIQETATRENPDAGPRGVGVGVGVAYTLDRSNTPQAVSPGPVLAFSSKDHGGDAGPDSPTLRSMGHAGSHPNGGGQVAISVCLGSDPISARECAMPQTRRNGDPGVVLTKRVVRRITPLEAERLQGFMDGYTAIPGAKDGPRYKALGNSMAVPCMRWIGERIAKCAITSLKGGAQ